jgi:hypothetical protein
MMGKNNTLEQSNMTNKINGESTWKKNFETKDTIVKRIQCVTYKYIELRPIYSSTQRSLYLYRILIPWLHMIIPAKAVG